MTQTSAVSYSNYLLLVRSELKALNGQEASVPALHCPCIAGQHRACSKNSTRKKKAGSAKEKH